MKQLLSILLVSILMAIPAQAKVFRNAYIAFEMPETWKCNLEVTEWVCRSEQSKEAKEALIILTAKEVGPSDSFPLYEDYLNKSIPLKLKTGMLVDSKIAYKAKTVNINDQAWIDGLHLGSEVPNYFTRYLATIKDNIAILVTLSAHKNYYTRYSQEFYKTVMSLKVVATKNLAGRPDLGPIRPGEGGMLGPGSVSGSMPGDLLESEDLTASSGKGKGKAPLIILALVLAAAGAYLFLKKKKT